LVFQFEKKRKLDRAFLVLLALSLFIHGIALVQKMTLVSHNDRADIKENIDPIKLILMQDKIKQKSQIVNTEKLKEKRDLKNEAFLGEVNQQVERQTIAKVVDKFKKAGFGNNKVAQKDGRKKAKKKVVKVKDLKDIKLADLAQTQIADSEEFSENKGREGIELGDKMEKGLAQNNDYVDDIPLGDLTLLNTTEYKYYGFYFRIRQQLEQHWGLSLKQKAEVLFKSGRRVASDEDRITSVVVQLDDKGNVIDVVVRSTSGLRELDDAAVESFNRAGPFPNPPRGMIKNGRAKIEWGFVVKS